MAKPLHVLLAEALGRVKSAAHDGIVQAKDMSRRDRERLLGGGWLQPVIAGWYLFHSPQGRAGESTAWYASFWDFVQQYLSERYDDVYCLSAESSLDIHVANTVIPKQVVVLAKVGGNHVLPLPHGTSLLVYQESNKFPSEVEKKNLLRVMPIGMALTRVSKLFFTNEPLNAEIALRMVRDPSVLTRYLVQDGMVASAGRLAGAYGSIAKSNYSDEIIRAMKALGYAVSKDNPFGKEQYHLSLQKPITSPYFARILSMWQTMREDVIEHFPKRRPTRAATETVLHRIDDVYVNDAYHSLSIEGSRVSPDLIERVKNGAWDPDNQEADRQSRDAMAAKGYYETFLAVKGSIQKVLEGADPAKQVRRDLSAWYQALFSPSAIALIWYNNASNFRAT